ncbi:MAG: O-antigen ligase family protein [Spongiibacteraceae bacterium]
MRVKYGPMRFRPNSPVIFVLIALLIISPFLTYLFNRDPVPLSGWTLPGLSFNDVINAEFHNLCRKYIPLLLGFVWLSDPKTHPKLLATLSVAGLIYSIPMLWEVRMSPQLNIKLYGYFPGGFEQSIRAGGFRPVVFLEHGLRVAVFFFMSITATMAIYRAAQEKNRKPENENSLRFDDAAHLHLAEKNSRKERKELSKYRYKLLYMFVVLFLCKTWSALIYTAVAYALIFYTKPRVWVKFSVVILMLVFIFPAVRSAGWIPTQQISNFFSQYSDERSDSLQYRFDNEDILLERANERPLAGWGGWGRNRIYNELGQDVSVTDGEWIIVYGTTGWVGYIAGFGLLVFPVLLVSRKLNAKKDRDIPICTAGIFIILAINMLDLIPNSSMSPLMYLLSGTLLGYAKWLGQDCQVTDSNAKTVAWRKRTPALRLRHEGFSRG